MGFTTPARTPEPVWFFDDCAFLEARAKGWRPISSKRARKLRRRGEHVRWLPEFDSLAWQPPHLKGKDSNQEAAQ